MTREEAMERLNSPDPLGYDELDSIFEAFGFESSTPSWETEVYSHPQWPHCGAFTARDDGVHVLTPLQRGLARSMIECVLFCEQYQRGDT